MLLACGGPPFMIVGFWSWVACLGLGFVSLVTASFHANVARSLGIGPMLLWVPVALLCLLYLAMGAPIGIFSAVLIGSPIPAATGLTIARHRGAGKPPDPNRCRTCNYELRGLIKPRCPECGTPFAAHRLRPPTKP